MTKIERGSPFPDVLQYLEAQEIKPYPPWRVWRNRMLDTFEERKLNFKNGDCSAEPYLHEFYVLRRLAQRAQRKKRKVDNEALISVREKMVQFWKKVEENIPTLEAEYGDFFQFIIRNTPIG